MTEDSTQQPESSSPSPQANPSAAGPNAPRQKQSFRRRRKRRGSGGNPGQTGNPTQAAANGPANGSAAPAPQGNAPRNENQPRKKKRFFKKNQRQGQNQANAGGARGDSRGNSTGQQQQRRGSKQRRPKAFVGPMDHSYRAANGNYSDVPPSTIELQRGFTNVHYNGNGNGNFNADHSSASRSLDDIQGSASAAGAADVAAATPVRIYCFIDDLFFIAKIQETARKLGIKVAFVKNEKDTIADLLALPEEERPTLIVFDLNSATAKPLTLIPKLKAKLKRATSIVGFLSHLQGELKAKAIEAGCDAVMPRSAFSQTLPNLLRRYGIEVEIEDDQAQVIEA
ncbi:MAG: response regulator [Acidobacteriaceae bacterium]